MNLNSTGPWLAGVLGVLQEALSADVKAVLSQLSSQLPLGTNHPSADCAEQLDSADALIQAQTMALEILTNLTASQGEIYKGSFLEMEAVHLYIIWLLFLMICGIAPTLFFLELINTKNSEHNQMVSFRL